MALKALMLRKKIDARKKLLESLNEKDSDFSVRKEELVSAINEAEKDEELDAVNEEIEKLESDIAANNSEKEKIEGEIAALADELAEIEKEDEPETEAVEEVAEVTPEDPTPVRKDEEVITMDKRNIFAKMNMEERKAIFAQDDVKGWVNEFRSAIKEKRALNNIGLTIPEVFLGYLRQNIENYSKLYKHVTVRRISGQGREVIEGTIPEAVWTECCANINELDLSWNDVETGCFKVAGFFKVCNATLEDSDIDLASELLTAIGQAIGRALDKAILFGRNTSANYKMPLGIVSRLAQESQPADYSATARTWADLHSTHMLTISNAVTGLDLFKTILLDSAVIDNKYARGEKVWVMNETTRIFLMAQGMNINAAGQIVVPVDGSMPVVGGIIEVLDFMPNYVIVGGYFDLYLLAERAGQQFASSEHVKFLQDQTVFRGTARYDGLPVIAESFLALGINGTSPTATMTFAADNANTVTNLILNRNSAAITAATGSTHTVQLKASFIPEGTSGTITWASSVEAKATVSSSGLVTGAASGSTVITATCGDAVAVCNVTVS